MSRLTRMMCLAGLAMLLLAAGARAVINPRFTPVDLVRGSSRILVLKVNAAEGGQVTAEAVEAIRGQLPADRQITFSLADGEVDADEIDKALAGEKSDMGLMLLSRSAKEDDDAPAGSLLIGIRWYAIHGQEGQWRLDRDKQDRFAVWAGSAAMLARGAKQTLKSAKMSFPVRCDMSWEGESQLGQVKGKVNGCIVADLGGLAGKCVVVLSDGGDRVYRMGREGQPPADVTAAMKLTTASRLGAAGDFDGDGRTDLALWDGRAITLTMQTAEGTFAAKPGAELAGCVSLTSMKDGRLVAGTRNGPVVIGKGQITRLQAPLDMGDGGVCIPADFDGDGHEDILQVFERGIALCLGVDGARFGAMVTTAVDLVSKPRVVVCGDYDADGKLDLVIGGADGLALLMRDEQGTWRNATGITGELAYHGNMNRPAIVAGTPADVNSDGRAGVALFYGDRQPLLFFNRGFACFGWARELELSQSSTAADAADPFAAPAQASESKVAAALGRGQQAGTMVDVDGDGTPDLLAVDRDGNVWAMHGRGKRAK